MHLKIMDGFWASKFINFFKLLSHFYRSPPSLNINSYIRNGAEVTVACNYWSNAFEFGKWIRLLVYFPSQRSAAGMWLRHVVCVHFRVSISLISYVERPDWFLWKALMKVMSLQVIPTSYVFSFLQLITKKRYLNISINFVLMETGNEKLEIEYEIWYGNRFQT